MKKQLKIITSVLFLAILISMACNANAMANIKNFTLKTKKMSVLIGKQKELKTSEYDTLEADGVYFAGGEYVKWSVVSGEEHIELSKKSEISVTITGLSKGTSKIKAELHDNYPGSPVKSTCTCTIKVKANPEGTQLIDFVKKINKKGGEIKTSLDKKNFTWSGRKLVGMTFTKEKDLPESVQIPAFKNLKWLKIRRAEKLKNLDVSKCKTLENIKFSYCELSNLNINGHKALTKISYISNKITNLKMTNCPSVSSLDCSQNKIEKLDLSGCYNLQKLNCEKNSLKNLDLSECPNIQILNCNNNQFKQLDFSVCPSIKKVYCKKNQFKQLDLSKCPNIQYIVCDGNQLKQLDVSNCTNLIWISCNRNVLKEIDCKKL